jgi:hypothetical protein
MERVTGGQAPAVRARSVARDRHLYRQLGPACRQSAIFGPRAGHVSDITGLLKWQRFELALGTQHDHRLAPPWPPEYGAHTLSRRGRFCYCETEPNGRLRVEGQWPPPNQKILGKQLANACILPRKPQNQR